MSVTLPEQKLTYFSVPKVACTSIKHFFFEIENDFKFQLFQANNKPVFIHDFYPGKPFHEWNFDAINGHVKLAVVRDPVERFISCYQNRVFKHEDLIYKSSLPPGLDVLPDLDVYTDNFEQYRQFCRPILSHSNPMVERLGTDPSFFDHVFSINELNEFTQTVAAVLGREVPRLQRHQTTDLTAVDKPLSKITRDCLSSGQIAYIKDFYAEDYKAFGDYF